MLTRARASVVLAWIIAVLLAATAHAQNTEVTILHMNDVYEISPVRGEGGLAELMTLLKAERQGHRNTLTAASGDFLSPSLGVQVVYDPKAAPGQRVRSVAAGN